MSDHEDTATADLTRLTMAVEHLTTEMATLNQELRELKDEHIMPLITDMAVQKVKLDRMSWIVYGCVAAVGTQILGVSSAFLIWFITTRL